MTNPAFVIRNNSAVFGWVFCALWIGMLGVFTWIFLRDGGFHQFDPLTEGIILGVFYICGFGAFLYFFNISRVEVKIAHGEVIVRERWVFSARVERFPVTQMGIPLVVRDKDSDGDPVFLCKITTPAGRTITLRETHDEAEAEKACDRVTAALRITPRG